MPSEVAPSPWAVIYCEPSGYGTRKLESGKAPRYGSGAMIGTEALQSVQFVTVKGKRLAVLNSEDWEALIKRL
jgi:hypothetical protein